MDEQTFEANLRSTIEASGRLRPEFEGRYYRWAFLGDDTSHTEFDRHYVYHVAWAVKKIAAAPPTAHVDFSSSLHFCTTLSAIRETTFYDFRPAAIQLSALTCLQADLTRLPMADNSLPSVSCMHVIEHIGLGRYGDEIDALGDLKAIAELKRVTAPGGRLYVVVPTGLPCITINAHRVYDAATFVAYFTDTFTLEEFYFIQDVPGMAPVLNPDFAATRDYAYGCGCYLFSKHT